MQRRETLCPSQMLLKIWACWSLLLHYVLQRHTEIQAFLAIIYNSEIVQTTILWFDCIKLIWESAHGANALDGISDRGSGVKLTVRNSVFYRWQHSWTVVWLSQGCRTSEGGIHSRLTQPELYVAAAMAPAVLQTVQGWQSQTFDKRFYGDFLSNYRIPFLKVCDKNHLKLQIKIG